MNDPLALMMGLVLMVACSEIFWNSVEKASERKQPVRMICMVVSLLTTLGVVVGIIVRIVQS